MYNRLFIIVVIVICISCKEEVFINQQQSTETEEQLETISWFMGQWQLDTKMQK